MLGGKTGTAEFGRGIRSNPRGRFYDAHAWFTCFAPFDKPEVAICRLRRVRRRRFDERRADCRQGAARLPRADASRKRGMVLREDGEPVSDQVASPLDDPNAGKIKSEHAGSDAGPGRSKQ